jgi:hypothetical protein
MKPDPALSSVRRSAVLHRMNWGMRPTRDDYETVVALIREYRKRNRASGKPVAKKARPHAK